MTGEGLPLLVGLVDSGIIRILDLAFATRHDDGSITAMDISEIDGDGQLDLAVFPRRLIRTPRSRRPGESAAVLEPGTSAGILVYQNVWAAPFAAACAAVTPSSWPRSRLRRI